LQDGTLGGSGFDFPPEELERWGGQLDGGENGVEEAYQVNQPMLLMPPPDDEVTPPMLPAIAPDHVEDPPHLEQPMEPIQAPVVVPNMNESDGGVKDAFKGARTQEPGRPGSALPVGGEGSEKGKRSSGSRRGLGSKRKVEEEGKVVEPMGKRARRVVNVVNDWKEDARKYFLADTFGTEWVDCIGQWLRFEMSMQVVCDQSRLPAASSRPLELSKWFVMGRSYSPSNMPTVDDLDDFADRWTVWWNQMQPNVRRSEGGMPRPLDESMRGQMVVLKKAGVTGLSVVLVGLRWWAPLGGERWLAAVMDVAACLEMFAGKT
jgi:hypothetical protein